MTAAALGRRARPGPDNLPGPIGPRLCSAVTVFGSQAKLCSAVGSVPGDGGGNTMCSYPWDNPGIFNLKSWMTRREGY